jgi:hypothetical protein
LFDYGVRVPEFARVARIREVVFEEIGVWHGSKVTSYKFQVPS